MEIIRDATFHEAIRLDPNTELFLDTVITWLLPAMIIGGTLSIILMTLGAEELAFGPIFLALLGLLGMTMYSIKVDGQLEAEYTHNYSLAIIDNSENFERDDYELLDHHEDNTYFLEKTTDN